MTTIMKKAIRYLSSLLLMAVLTAPLALQAQDRDDRHDRDRDNQRVYDRDHKDYHQWNADEDRSYREWYEDTHHGKKFRDYSHLKRKDQDAYWKWRHERGDRDDRH
jgi:Ni/Co efflux regulator RcnB